jgi:flagellin-like hook-associated protein FlgL
MDEKEALKQGLEQELQWVLDRMKILDIIEDKLVQMREIALQAKEENLSAAEIEVLNSELNHLAAQVNALDEDNCVEINPDNIYENQKS